MLEAEKCLASGASRFRGLQGFSALKFLDVALGSFRFLG